MTASLPPHEVLVLENDSPEVVRETLDARGWGDGLPVVAPTFERVAAMLAYDSGGDPDEIIATLPPRQGLATRRTIAVNAVMAGCRPELLPLLVQVVRALASPALNLASVNATTHAAAPLVIVHGEAADALGFNSGSGTFGPGFAANATFGRALRLLLLHCAGAWPGNGDQSTQGQPSKYAFCIAENSAANPWESYPESIGITAPSAVSLFMVEGPHNVHDMESDSPEPLLDKLASVMTPFASNQWPLHGNDVLVALCPEHAATIAARKWTREDVRSYLFHRARARAGAVKEAYANRSWPRWMRRLGDDELVPVTDHPDKFRVVVTGGPGKHSSVLPGFGIPSLTFPVSV